MTWSIQCRGWRSATGPALNARRATHARRMPTFRLTALSSTARTGFHAGAVRLLLTKRSRPALTLASPPDSVAWRGFLIRRAIFLSWLVGLGFVTLWPGAQATALGAVRGDFNGDGRDDLAVGVPSESVGSASEAGAVNVLYGGAGGLSATGNQ